MSHTQVLCWKPTAGLACRKGATSSLSEMNLDEEAMLTSAATLPRAASLAQVPADAGRWAMQDFAMFTVERARANGWASSGPGSRKLAAD